MKIAILENGDIAEIAEFLTDDAGCRLIFDSYEAADDYLVNHCKGGVYYRFIADDDD